MRQSHVARSKHHAFRIITWFGPNPLDVVCIRGVDNLLRSEQGVSGDLLVTDRAPGLDLDLSAVAGLSKSNR